MTDEQLRSSLEEATRTNRALTLENEVFERYLRRRDPQCLHKLSVIAEAARQAQKIARLRTSHPAMASRLNSSTTILSDRPRPSTASLSQQTTTRNASGSQHLSTGGLPKQRSAAAKGAKITIAHRIDLANKEVEYMLKQCVEFERSAKSKKLELTVQSEEMRQRMNDSIEAATKFETEVLNGVDPAKRKVPIDKLVRFIEDQLKLAATIIDRLNLKIVTCKRLIRQTKKYIQQREELGKTIRPIDFEKLEIENEYIVLENEKLSKRLTTQKHIMGHFNLTLKHRKDTLLERRSKLQALQTRILERKRENIELRHYQARAMHGLQKVSDQLAAIKRLQEHYEAPAVEQFLEVQKQLQEARRHHKRLARQRKIQLFTLKSRQKSD